MIFRANPNFAAELAADPETKGALLEFADTALEAARASAPVSPGPRGGGYRDSLFADEDGLGSTSSIWGLLEYGTVEHPPLAILRNAVAATGAEWKDGG